MNARRTERRRIVVIDDDKDFQALLRTWLNPRHDVLPLLNGEGVLEELSEIELDLVIMDVRMPGPDGYALCHAIRSQARFAGLPVLFLTACKADEDFLKTVESGGTAYRTKPIERKALLKAVDELLAEGAFGGDPFR